MGLIFRRSVRLLPGLKLNFGKKGTSVTVGTKGAHMTYGKGRKTASVGVPGTGIYYRKTVSTKGKQPVNTAYNSQKQVPLRTKAANQAWGCVFLAFSIVILFLAFVVPMITLERFLVAIFGAFMLVISLVFFNAESSDEPKPEEGAEKKKSKIPEPAIFGFGIFLLILFGYLFFASFGWSWQEHVYGKFNRHDVYDLSWLKWIFYPIDIVGLLSGVIFAYIGMTTDNEK